MAKKDKNFPMQGKMGGMGGKYGRKAENLTKKELKAAGGLKASKARTVSISNTKRIYEGALKGKTVGPGGKPLTGRVKLESGAWAVYKGGKRVMKAAKPAPSAGRAATSSGGGSTPSSKTQNAASIMKLGKKDKVRTSLARDTARASQRPTASATPSKTGNRTATSATVSAAQKTAKPSGSTSVSRPRAGGGRGVGVASVGGGSLIQARIRGLEKRISDARAQLKANAAKSASDARARAQAQRDRQLIRDLESQLRNLR